MQAGIDFTHVIMTRFNVERPKRHDPMRLDPGWLAGRFDLFEKYCLPSVAAQTAGNFTWMIYFDAGTPQAVRDRVEACRRVHPFVAYYGGTVSAAFWPRSVEETLVGNGPDGNGPDGNGPDGKQRGRTPWLLTTRFDNDDALAEDFVARLQAAVAAAEPPERGSWNFPEGFVLEGGKLYALTHLANPFASWLEPWGEKTRTAISINHLKMTRVAPVTQVGWRGRLAAGGAWRQRLEQGARPPGAAGGGGGALPRPGDRRPAPGLGPGDRARKPGADPDPQRPRHRGLAGARPRAGGEVG